MKMLTAALGYVETLGWAVFPLHTPEAGKCSCGRVTCGSVGKHPRTLNGVKDASKDVEQVRTWWGMWPDANIGLATGQVNGIVVVDIDGPEGEKALAAICGNPPTPTSLTGKGRHAIFRAPSCTVSNKAALATQLDIRADGGYIVAPPSLHETGRRYAWDRDNGMGPRDMAPAPLPPALLERLLVGQPSGRVAADIPAAERIPDGTRNQTLTSYAGRLLAKGHSVDETHQLLSALNESKCVPPLPAADVERIVRSIGEREAAKRPPLQLVVPDDNDAVQLARAQVEEAKVRGSEDYSLAPKWRWDKLHRLVGPVIPGELWTVGARPGHGKTTFLLSWAEFLAEMMHTAWLYIGMEMDASQLRRKWSAWRCGLNEEFVLTNNWAKLPAGAKAQVEEDLETQASDPLVRLAHFAPGKRIDVAALKEWVTFATDHGCRVVVIDHFHRMAFGDEANWWFNMSETAREAKEFAKESGVAIVMAAQLNRGGRDVIEQYYPPPLTSLKACGTIEEESDVVLMLHRKLLQGTKKMDMAAVREGLMPITDIVEENAMGVWCRKHRRNGNAQDKCVTLYVYDGVIKEHPYAPQAVGEAS